MKKRMSTSSELIFAMEYLRTITFLLMALMIEHVTLQVTLLVLPSSMHVPLSELASNA